MNATTIAWSHEAISTRLRLRAYSLDGGTLAFTYGMTTEVIAQLLREHPEIVPTFERLTEPVEAHS